MADFHETMATGYGFGGDSVALGRPLTPGGAPATDVEIRIPVALLNRHGLITGATGTGKTKTLQLLAEQISALGCPVFAADMKGDLAGIGAAGEGGGEVAERAEQLGHAWAASAAPVELLSLAGEDGVALRASVASFGHTLLSKILSLNDTQEPSLGLVFRFCEDKGLALIELSDLRATLAYLVGPGKADLESLGGLSKATVGVLQRKVSAAADPRTEAGRGAWNRLTTRNIRSLAPPDYASLGPGSVARRVPGTAWCTARRVPGTAWFAARRVPGTAWFTAWLTAWFTAWLVGGPNG